MMKICHSQSALRPEAAQGYCQFPAVTAKPVLSLQTCAHQRLCARANPFVYVSTHAVFMYTFISICMAVIANVHGIL